MDNIIIANITSAQDFCLTRAAWQGDYGQILKPQGIDLPEAYEVHFANQQTGGVTVTQIGNEDGVTIPDSMFLSGSDVYAFIYLHTGEDDGETVYKIMIPVKDRPLPSDEQPTPVQQSAIDQAIIALNDAVESTAEEVAAARSAAAAADASANRAEQAAANAGYMFFYIDDNGDLIYQRTSNTEVDFYLSNGDLYVKAVG